MRYYLFYFLLLLLFTYSINGHQHISRKMEDHVHDSNHIRQDLQGQINKSTDHMTEDEQNFYYFKFHDTNHDNQLDGLEVISAFSHVHSDETDNNHNNSINRLDERIPDDELINIVDDILKEEDLNRDGFISYEEFQFALETVKTRNE